METKELKYCDWCHAFREEKHNTHMTKELYGKIRKMLKEELKIEEYEQIYPSTPTHSL